MAFHSEGDMDFLFTRYEWKILGRNAGCVLQGVRPQESPMQKNEIMCLNMFISTINGAEIRIMFKQQLYKMTTFDIGEGVTVYPNCIRQIDLVSTSGGFPVFVDATESTPEFGVAHGVFSEGKSLVVIRPSSLSACTNFPEICVGRREDQGYKFYVAFNLDAIQKISCIECGEQTTIKNAISKVVFVPLS